jgi:hypothetical protein
LRRPSLGPSTGGRSGARMEHACQWGMTPPGGVADCPKDPDVAFANPDRRIAPRAATGQRPGPLPGSRGGCRYPDPGCCTTGRPSLRCSRDRWYFQGARKLHGVRFRSSRGDASGRCPYLGQPDQVEVREPLPDRLRRVIPEALSTTTISRPLGRPPWHGEAMGSRTESQRLCVTVPTKTPGYLPACYWHPCCFSTWYGVGRGAGRSQAGDRGSLARRRFVPATR